MNKLEIKIESFLQREEDRWNGSLNTIYKNNLNAEDLSNLNYARTAVSWVIYELFKSIPGLIEEKEGRKNWERYLSGLKFLSTNIEHSFLIKNTLPIFGLGEAKDRFLSWNRESLKLINEIYFIGNRMDEYFKHLTFAIEKSEKSELCSLYSSLKTWDTEAKFDLFEKRISRMVDKPFEIYIEGPIQLFLMLSKNNFLFLLKAISVKKLSELILPKKIEENDLNILNERVNDLITNSKTLKYFLKFLKETIQLSIKSWVTEQRERRKLISTPSGKINFVKNFENGIVG